MNAKRWPRTWPRIMTCDYGLRGAAAAAQLPGRRHALVPTLDQSDRFVEDGIEIEVQPAWRWLLAPTRT